MAIYRSLKFAKVTIQFENSAVFYTHSEHYSRQTVQSFNWSHYYYILRQRPSARNKVNQSGIMTTASAKKGPWWRGERARSRGQGLYICTIKLNNIMRQKHVYFLRTAANCRDMMSSWSWPRRGPHSLLDIGSWILLGSCLALVAILAAATYHYRWEKI